MPDDQSAEIERQKMEIERQKIILELYNELGRNERHFNDLESKYRFLASAWALATLAAIGYIQANGSQTFFGYDKSIVEAAVGLLGAFGVTLVWGLDVRVYHQLLDGNFVESLELERQHLWLPGGRLKFFSKYVDNVDDGEKPDILKQIRLFYIWTIGIGLAIVSFFGAQFMSTIPTNPTSLSPLLAVAAGVLLGAIGFAWLFYVWRASRSIPIDNWVKAQIARKKALADNERNGFGKT